jgi:hypothetical protein
MDGGLRLGGGAGGGGGGAPLALFAAAGAACFVGAGARFFGFAGACLDAAGLTSFFINPTTPFAGALDFVFFSAIELLPADHLRHGFGAEEFDRQPHHA